MDLENYPHLFPPPGFIPVNRVGSIVVPPNQTEFFGVLENDTNGDDRILIPTINEGWLYLAGIVLSRYDNCSWSITASGVALRDYTRRNGPLQAPETPGKVLLRLPASQPLDIGVLNADPVNAVSCRWRLFGWYYKPS